MTAATRAYVPFSPYVGRADRNDRYVRPLSKSPFPGGPASTQPDSYDPDVWGSAHRAAPYAAPDIDPRVCGRVASTFGYAAAGLTASLAAGAAAFSAGVPLIAATHPIAFPVACAVGAMGAAWPTLALDPDAVVAKHTAWLSFSAILGASACNFGFLGAPILLPAGIVTAGVMGATACIANLCSNVSVATVAAPVLAGAMVLSLGTLGCAFIPALSGAAASLSTVMALSAGVSSLVTLLDMRQLIEQARRHDRRFDPIGRSLVIHLDAMEIFSRVALSLVDD